MNSKILRSRAFFPAALYLIISLVFTQLPLLNYLGYEFSAAIALIASFVSGFLTIKFTRLQSNPSSTITNHPIRDFLRALILNLSLLIIPLAVILANAFFVKNCSLLQGFGFFVLIPVVSVAFSSALGFFCAAHYRHAKIIFTLFLAVTVVYALAMGYFTPAIFSYNFFYGFFPGLTYDEALGISPALVWFRLVTLFVAGIFVWLTVLLLRTTSPSDSVWKKGTTLLRALAQGRTIIVTGVVVLMLGLLWWFRGELGFESHRRFIQQRLGSSFETKHFVIFYAKESYDEEEIQWIAAEHEFRLKQISDVLSVPFKGKIESYIYPSDVSKQRLIGAGNTNIAKPWSSQIHITKQSLDGTLKHELVHVLAAPFGLPIINASLSTGIVEGLATAIDWDWGNRTPHQYAAAMRKFGVTPDIAPLMTPAGFAAQSSSVSYVLAGSFCRYLIDTHGIRAMMLLYRATDYEKIYGKPLEQLIADWQIFLDKIPVRDEDRDAIDVYFRRPPIFRKVCARVIAGRNNEASKKFAQRNYAAAAELYEQSFGEGRGYESLSGYIASTLYASKYSAVNAAFDTIIRPNTSHYLPLLLNAGLAQYATGNYKTAQELFRRLEKADLSEPLTEAAIVRSVAIGDTLNRAALLKHFLSTASDSERVTMLDSLVQHPSLHWLPIYLKGKALFRLRRWKEALQTLEELNPRLDPKPLEAIRLKTSGYALFRLRRFEDAKSRFWESLNFVDTEAAKNEVNDWVERCDWMEENK